MRKVIPLIGVIFISLLLISNSSAVPQTHSEPVMDLIDEIEKQKSQYEDVLSSLLKNILPVDDIIDFIIRIIQWLMQLVINLVEVVSYLIILAQAVDSLVKLMEFLFNLIQSIIDIIMGWFNPDTITTCKPFVLYLNLKVLHLLYYIFYPSKSFSLTPFQTELI